MMRGRLFDVIEIFQSAFSDDFEITSFEYDGNNFGNIAATISSKNVELSIVSDRNVLEGFLIRKNPKMIVELNEVMKSLAEGKNLKMVSGKAICFDDFLTFLKCDKNVATLVGYPSSLG